MKICFDSSTEFPAGIITDIFSGKKKKVEKQREHNESKLFEEIGRLKVEVDWLKKKSDELDQL